jgi:hypothetical protein
MLPECRANRMTIPIQSLKIGTHSYFRAIDSLVFTCVAKASYAACSSSTACPSYSSLMHIMVIANMVGAHPPVTSGAISAIWYLTSSSDGATSASTAKPASKAAAGQSQEFRVLELGFRVQTITRVVGAHLLVNSGPSLLLGI